jgi:small conductance mechanosensitive channel
MEQQAKEAVRLYQASPLAVHYSLSILGALPPLILGWLLASFVSPCAFEGIPRVREIDVTLARFFTNVLHMRFSYWCLSPCWGSPACTRRRFFRHLVPRASPSAGTCTNLRPYTVGEYIATSRVSATVREIGLFATELKTTEGLYLPTRITRLETAGQQLQREPTRKNDLGVNIGYGGRRRLGRRDACKHRKRT